jgi:putative hydrolase of the HAD superfamily
LTIRGVLFDVDNTLFDYPMAEEVGVLAHLRAEGILDRFPDPSEVLTLWQTITEAEYARFLNGELTFIGQQRERTRKFLARIGQSELTALSDQEAAAWFERYKTHRHAHWTAFPDADRVLGKLAPDYRLGIVSNSSLDHQRGKLDAIGLLAYFGDSLICSDPHGAAKPAPSIFLAGCSALGLRPHEVAYVGDDYELDAVGAYEAGLHAFWLDRSNSGADSAIQLGIRVIYSLDEILAALND